MPRKRHIDIRSIFLGLQRQMSSRLSLNKSILNHPVAKGDASELEWTDLLNTYLPKRYQADRAFVLDHKGSISDQIDIVIFDRHFSPFLLKQNGATYVPAESVYAVIEVKQKLDASTLRYAAEKATSVRRLIRTSASIVDVGTVKPPRKQFEVLAGILTLNGSFRSVTSRTLKTLRENERINFGCSLEFGAFTVDYTQREPKVMKTTGDDAFVLFFLRLIAELQKLGSVPAMDIDAYIQSIKSDH